ncbi:Signal transducer and activator of transcription 5A-like protein, partial [Leptotrombidium deliense]
MKTPLWNKVKQLPEVRKQCLVPLYNQIPFVIRSSLPEFFEAYPWYQINMNEPTHRELVNNAFFVLIQNLRTKLVDKQNAANLELMTTTENLANMFYNRSADFVNTINYMLQQEMNEVIAELEYFGSENKITNLDIENNIEVLNLRVQQCKFETQKLHYAKEQYLIKCQDLAKRHIYLQQFPANGQMKDIKHKYQLDTSALELSLKSHVVEIKKSVEHLRQTITAVKAVQNYVLKQHLGSWIHHQKLEALGYPPMCNLQTIQLWCESIAKILWDIKIQLETIITTCDRFHNALKDEVAVMRSGLINQIINLVSETFIVEKQPPQVVKTSTQF